MKLAYFISSLPALAPGRIPQIGMDDFQSAARGWITGDEYAVLDVVVSGEIKPGMHPFVDAWIGRETAFRNAIARHRAALLKVDPSEHLRKQEILDLSMDKAVIDAYLRSSPDEREIELDRYRWKMLDDISGFNPFQMSGLLAYAMKLRMGWRWARMQDARGREKLDVLIEATV